MNSPQQVPQITHREVIGRSPDELQVGNIIKHETKRTLQDFDNAVSTLLAMNTHPAHIDYEYAATTQFGKPLVVSPLLASSLSAIFFNDFRELRFQSFEIQSLRFMKPIFPGNTIRAQTEVLERSSSSIRVKIEGFKTVNIDGYQPTDTKFSEFNIVIYL